jgi:glycine oxidase
VKAIVVGGGAIGCASALALAKRGAKVILLERTAIGAEASSAAAGILGGQLEAHADGPMTRLCLASRERFPVWVRDLTRETGVDIGYHASGAMKIAMSRAALEGLVAMSAWQREAGLRVEVLDAKAARALEPSLGDVAGAVRFPDDGLIDPPRLLAALRVACERAGVDVRVGHVVRRVRLEGDASKPLAERGRALGVALEHGETLDADRVVIAAGSWSSLIENVALVDDAVRPARGQVLELVMPRAPFSNVLDGPSYMSPRADGRVLVGSTVELVGYDRGVTAGAARDLLEGALAMVPSLASAKLNRSWAGLRPWTKDELPLIGDSPIPGLVIATGHFRNGVLLSPITGAIVAALCFGDASPVPSIDLGAFDPARFLRA